MLNLIPHPQNVKVNGLFSNVNNLKRQYIFDDSIPSQGYKIKIDETSATILHSDSDGKYYAELTLQQIQQGGEIAQCEIFDYPRFSFRSFMLDSSRHFQSVDEIKLFIQAAAQYKFNYFHWHLSDDQGFRIESEKFPFLNKIGSFRRHKGFGVYDNKIYGGYYTKAEICEIVEYCAQFHIEVIPELDMPGHTASWVASYALLGCKKENVEVKFKNGIKKDILCAGREETYDFCKTLIDEVAELFPCKYFHIGGDEVPKTNWKNCPDCQRKMKEENLKNEIELQSYFTNRIGKYLLSKGKIPIVWNDAISKNLDADIIAANWFDPKRKTNSFLARGGKVIEETSKYNYLDFPYSLISLKKCYSFKVKAALQNDAGRGSVIGIEAPLWTEWIDDFGSLCFQAFPRLMAVAENGWTQEEHKNYARFKTCVKAQKEKLAALGITMAKESFWQPDLILKIKQTKEWNKHFIEGNSNK